MNPSYYSGGPGSGAKPEMIASGNSGGIDMSKNMPKKSPKKILIAVVIVAVILVVAIVVVMMMMPKQTKAPVAPPSDTEVDNTGSDDTEETESDAADATTSGYKYDGKNKEFYQYANYILNGKKSVSNGLDLGNYSKKAEYKLVEAVENNNVQFMNQAVALWKTFVDSMSEVMATVQAENVLMDFLEKYAAMNTRTEAEMWKLYGEVGLDSATKMIKSDYNGLSSSSYEAGAKWAEVKAVQAEQALKLYAKYDELGCVKNNDFDQECINKNVNTLKAQMQEYKKAKAAVDETKFEMADFAGEIVKKCFEIRNELGVADSGASDTSDTTDNSGGNSSASAKKSEVVNE